MEAYENQDVPFERLVEEIAPERNLSRTPLIQALFILQTAADDLWELQGLEPEIIRLPASAVTLDLTMSVRERDDHFVVRTEYSTDLFDRVTVERMMGHFSVLLSSVVARPGARVGEVDVLSGRERRQLLVDFNDSGVDFPAGVVVHRLVEEQARLRPDAVAVVSGEERVSYRELNERANRLAHVLRGRGVGPDVLVGVCLERGVALVVALLGVLKAGGAYVPLDPEYPAERLAFMLRDTAAPVVVSQSGLRDRLPTEGCAVVCLDEVAEELGRQPVTDPESGVSGDDLAYVIYTSGSTGTPKGVAIEHRNLISRLTGTEEEFRFGPNDVWTLFHSIAFDFSVWEIWGALAYGGRLLVVDWETSRNPVAFARLLVEQRVTVLNQTPSAFALLQREVGPETAATLSLRLVIFGGEALHPARLQPWWDAWGTSGPRLVNMYGITETTVHVTVRDITLDDTRAGAVSPIGRPLAATPVFVLDTSGQLVPVGAPGELWVGGAGVARGYVNRPDLTGQRFAERQFDESTHRLYRSGDLVRWSQDGELEYLGRTDDQIKLRGFRVELGEIESAVTRHPRVTAAAVMMREDAPGHHRLAAYIVPADDLAPTGTALSDWCRQLLPDHMVPSRFVSLEALPVTANGKVDRQALPALDSSRPQLGSAYVAPRTPAEEQLAQLWADVLGVERVGVHDNFFELGGDSIRSLLIISRAKRLGLNLTPRLIFQHQTVADVLASAQKTAPGTERPGRDAPTRYPLAPMQLGILFHAVTESAEVNPYVVQFPDEFVGPLDVRHLRDAWQTVADRHTVLRSEFSWEGLDEPVQEVRQRVDVPFQEADWRECSAADQKARLTDLLEADRLRGFDLGSAPLMRITMVRLATERWLVLWSFHHLLLDGWSAQLVQKEVFAHYRAALDGQALHLPEPEPFARYIEWLGKQSHSEAEAFWRGTLGTFEAPTALGVDRATGDCGFDDVVFEVDAAASAQLREFARNQRVTVNTVVQGAWALLLSRYSGTDDVVYGALGAVRPADLSDAESMIGLFINTLPMRVQVDGGTSVDVWLRGLQHRQSEVRAYEHSSLAEVQGWSAIPKGERLFKTLLAFQNFPELGGDDLPNGLRRISSRNVERTGYPLTAIVYDNERLKVDIAYDKSLFDRETVEQAMGHFVNLMTSITTDPHAPVAQVGMLTAQERRRLTVDFNAGPSVPDDHYTLHALVEAQARLRPEAVAVAAGDMRLSYRELNERANRLAHHLRGRGVRSEDLVAVCLERGWEMIVALLGVLKAGGAYVPLDPEHPRARMEFVLKDTAAPVVITQSSLRDRLPGGDYDLVCLDAQWSAIEQESAGDPAPAGEPDDLAYIIYTSGSTGTPKGVAVRHRSVVNRLRGTDDDFCFGAEDVWPLFHSFAFDVSVWEIWGALTYGGRLVVVSHATTRNAAAFLDLLIEHRVTVLNQTPSAFGLLQQVISRDRAQRLSLRLVIFAGEALQPASLRPWRAATDGKGPRLLNMYGITEATVHVTRREITDADIQDGSISPIGGPLADTDVYVLSASGELVPVGVPGELWVAGTGLAREYLNRPDLTTERFAEREIEGRTVRLYRSGDLVRWLPNGELEYLGRLDDQVKVRGFRIELGEIESALLAHPQVGASVVMMREDVPGDRRLVAYVVPVTGTGPSTAELREHCQQSLPGYMLPSGFLFLQALPLTVNGKVDRRALPAPDGLRPDLESEYVPPRNRTEETLVAIWEDVLGISDIGIHDNFFEIGGDSILGLLAVSRAKRHGINLHPQVIFEHETVSEIARHVTHGVPTPAKQTEVPGDGTLTPIQQWFFEWDVPDGAPFNQVRLLRTQGLQAAALETALARVVEHHDMLRSRFAPSESGWTQTYATATPSGLLVRHDLSDLTGPELWSAFRREADALHRAVDPRDGSVFRAALFELGAEHGQRLLLVAHHLVVDGVSWRIILQDLGQAYRSLAAGEQAVLPDTTTSYQSWAGRLRHYATSGQATAELDHWLRPRTARPLPRDAAGANTVASYAVVTRRLDSDETTALLRDVPRRFDVRINDVLLTAVAQAVCGWAGHNSVLVALEGHGREHLLDDVDLTRTVGWFTSLFPVELRAEPGADPVTTLADVKQRLMAVPHRGVGYGIQRYLGSADVREHLSSLAQPDISFNYLGQFESALPGLGQYADDTEPRGQSVDPRARRPHLIDVIASVQAGSLVVSVAYSTNVYDSRTIENITSSVVTVLRSLVQAPGGAVEHTESPTDVIESYELTPQQKGLLFHSLSDPSEESDVRPYVIQMVDEFTGQLDPALFRQAWQQVVERHAVLRGGIVTGDGDEPRQVVRRQTAITVDELDWCETTEAEQQQLMEKLLADDRQRGFDLSTAPLMRFTLVRTGQDRTLVVWSSHQLLLDGWSSQIVQQEFAALYQAAAAGRAADLSTPVPYSRYIEWLRRQPTAEAQTFWEHRLAGFQAPTSFGVERETGRTGYADHLFDLGADEFAALRDFARAKRITVNTVFQGLWALLLARYSGTQDVLFGATVAGRPADLTGMERMVGPFINTLPVRVEVPGDAMLTDWLKHIQDQHAELRRYEYSSLASVQGWSQVPRAQQLFRSILVFENYPKLADGEELPLGLSRKRLHYVERTGYPLVLGIAEWDEELHFHLVHDQALFTPDTAQRMAGHLRTLLGSMLERPTARLRELRMVTSAELEQLAQWNGPVVDHPSHLTVPQLIERQASRTPDAAAVTFGETTLTYAELNIRANQLAHYLRHLGVRPEVVVGLCVERSCDMIVALLGILKSGGAYLPLDQDHPADRLAFMIDETETPVIVTQGHLADRFPANGVKTLCLDSDMEEISRQPATDPEPWAGPDDLAYIIYTSGSTGRPKGVMIEHRSMSDRVQEMRDRYRLTDEDVYLQFSSVTFDGSVGEIFPTLVVGAELVLRGEDWTPEWITETLASRDITVCQLPPFVWNELTSRLTSSTELGVRLRLMSMGGERVLPATAESWFRRTAVPLMNIYGPTETTVNMTTCLITRASGVVPIGSPVANTDVLVVDEHGNQVPIGVAGELWIGGSGVARGYLNRPELTVERFVAHPFANNPSRRMYRTGDLVRWLPDGDLEFLGRIDDQVKLRGFRIEPGEIESALLTHPEVTASAVVLRDDGDNGKRLVAYCVPLPGRRPTVTDLRDWCSRSLPDYMLPSAYVLMDTLPVTANGKAVNRKALPAPETVRPRVETEFLAPRTEMEQLVADIWRDALNVDRVGAHDNFFELGGDSYLSILVIAKARKKGLHLTPRVIFQTPSVAELAAHLEAMRARAGRQASPSGGAGAAQPSTAPAHSTPEPASAGRFTVVGSAEGHKDTRVALVRLNESSADSVTFCFHEGGGNVSGYVHLAEALAPVTRMIGIEARSVALGVEPEGDVAEMAQNYWAAMRTIQPTGPYVLVGWSFGGALAIEVARLVEKAGGQVSLLVALDSCLPVQGARGMIEREHSAIRRLLEYIDDAAVTQSELEKSAAVAKLMTEVNLPTAMLSLKRSELVSHLRTMEANTRAVFHYRPTVVRCPVVLYQAHGSSWPIPLAESWQPFAERVDFRTVSGDHLSFLRPPHVVALAKEITVALEKLSD
ncbi:amino acid adenylation domain-containing protein [Streptomyces sp. NPDC050535]|uniref:amino acid adenylation domain-containing protein n=1 Tax=Streptomyces sp. NPDC050535 TaxID=3365626 RepID=UPI0037A81BF7